MQGLCHVCLEQKEIEANNKCASCVHNGFSRKTTPESQFEMPTISDLKRKWEKR